MFYIMKAFTTQCFRCGKEINTPNSSKADYVINNDAINDGVQKTAIVCPDCYIDTDKVIWGVHGSQASEEARRQFEAYFVRVEMFRGLMCDLANTIEHTLTSILEKASIKLNKKEMLGRKIEKFKNRQETLSTKYAGDFNELVKKLNEFNENWVITKHGTTCGGHKDLSIYKIYKDDELYIFDQDKLDGIKQQFTEIVKALTSIRQNLS